MPSDGTAVTERDRELFKLEQDVLMLMHLAATDGSMLVRVECAIAIGRAAVIPPANLLQTGERELCHHGQFLKAFQAQKARVLLDMNHQRMSMMMLAPALHNSDAGVATPDTSGSRKQALRGTHSDGHVSHEQWLTADTRVHSGVARSETDMLFTRTHAHFHATGEDPFCLARLDLVSRFHECTRKCLNLQIVGFNTASTLILFQEYLALSRYHVFDSHA